MDIQRKLLIRDLRRLLQVLPARTRWQVAGLFTLMFFLAVTEVLSIFSMSFMAMTVAVPERILSHPLTQRIFSHLPALGEICSDPRYFTLLASWLVVLLIACKNGLTALTNWRSAWLGEEIGSYAGSTIMAHFLKSSYMDHMSGDSGAMFQALSWKRQLGAFVVNILNTYTYGITSIALFVTILSATPGAILSCLGITGLIVFVTYRTMKTNIDRCGKTSAQCEAAENRTSMTAMRGIREVILYRQQETFFEKYTEALKTGKRPHAFLVIAPPIPTWILEFFGFLSIPTVIWVLIEFQDANMVTITAVITLIMLVAWRILPILNRSLGCLVFLRTIRPMAMTCLDRLESIQKQNLPDPALPDPDFRFDREISLHDVCFRYPGADHDSLKSVDLRIAKGQQIGIIGPSGSGKTTLVGILCGLLPMSRGEMRVDGMGLTEERKAAYIQRVGYVSQTPYIFNGTIAENVAFSAWGKPCDRERVIRACHMAALELIDTDERGIDYPIGDNASGLSGGQAQRVSIARALYANPDVLILDESTSALDLGTEKAIMETIENLKGHLTIIIIAHRLSTVERCDTLFWIEEGRLRTQGTPAELLPVYTKSLVSEEFQKELQKEHKCQKEQ
ncbi:MAG TPA: ABC transporter ATP-binding protein/permease [Candidatus Desulfovibrio intestinipullorum]|uniref:ABC transporter ATP-binding protein/permease n=1 Tax=Candidatus Desulfovibrio intestinipullorum TaxID=2838536 RepID=A0A9D1TP48_9BACT|nr:ABC transporter ATP-binding protein/permease [Candidatus Desulfovibrio intestinipullorum]